MEFQFDFPRPAKEGATSYQLKSNRWLSFVIISLQESGVICQSNSPTIHCTIFERNALEGYSFYTSIKYAEIGKLFIEHSIEL
jgi:hypothetical protein